MELRISVAYVCGHGLCQSMLMRCILAEAVGIWFHPMDVFFGFLSYFCAIPTTMLKIFK